MNSFAGIVAVVSHDRYFLDNVADRLFAFEGNGRIRQYEGGYTDYLAARQYQESLAQDNGSESVKKTVKTAAKEWKQSRPVKLKFTYKEEREYETIDEDISRLEERIEELEKEMEIHATEPGKLMALTREKEETEAALETKMERWVYLNELAEKIEKQKNLTSGIE